MTNRPDPRAVYQGLRNQILQASREKLRLPAPPTVTEPWGVIMELGWPKATVTIGALSDGNASIYFSSGGGFIGGFGKPLIRTAGQDFVRVAAEFQPAMQLTTDFSLPEQGQARFYLLTDAGVYTISVPEEDLRQRRISLTKLYAAGQEVITQYRLDQKAE